MVKDPLSARLGTKLRQLRHERQLSLDGLAALTGVSKPMLGQIERGSSSPTVATLWKIASGLGVPFTALVSDAPEARLTRVEDLDVLYEDEQRFQVYTVYAETASPVEWFRVVLLPGCRRVAEPHGTGARECLSVCAGSMVVQVPDEIYQLGPGDVLQFAGDVPHTYENTTDHPCEVQMAIFYSNGPVRTRP